MNHASLFSGIGGFDLAAEKMGWDNILHCEINPFCQKILKYYWPNAITYTDIKQTDFTIHKGTIDVLTGGFPCQPYSTAGKRLGKQDERHLWPEMLRAIREIQPSWIVGENVRGIVSWNGGLVFDEVQSDLEAAGYEVQPFLLPASGVNAPHERYRIWFVAHSRGQDWKEVTKNEKREGSEQKRERPKVWRESSSANEGRNAANANGKRCGKQNISKESGIQERFYCKAHNDRIRSSFDRFPTQSPVCSRNDGIPGGLDGITFSEWVEKSLQGYGNAIVPQVAVQIFKAIEQYNQL